MILKYRDESLNIDVYGSDQNRLNPLLKVVLGASNNVVDCIVSPLGEVYFIIESFIQEICSKARFIQ